MTCCKNLRTQCKHQGDIKVCKCDATFMKNHQSFCCMLNDCGFVPKCVKFINMKGLRRVATIRGIDHKGLTRPKLVAKLKKYAKPVKKCKCHK